MGYAPYELMYCGFGLSLLPKVFVLYEIEIFTCAIFNIHELVSCTSYHYKLFVSIGLKESGEFAQIYNGYRGEAVSHAVDNTTVRVPQSGAVPDTVDWRTKGVVSEIKNQVRGD